MKRSDRILRRMVSARMISKEEYDAAMTEVPTSPGSSGRWRRHWRSRRPRRNSPRKTPGGGPGVIEPSPPVNEIHHVAASPLRCIVLFPYEVGEGRAREDRRRCRGRFLHQPGNGGGGSVFFRPAESFCRSRIASSLEHFDDLGGPDRIRAPRQEVPAPDPAPAGKHPCVLQFEQDEFEELLRDPVLLRKIPYLEGGSSGKRAAYIKARSAYSVFFDNRIPLPDRTVPIYPIRKIGYMATDARRSFACRYASASWASGTSLCQ